MENPTSTPPAVSVGPFDARPDGELRELLGDGDRRQRQLAWLTLVLERAGVDLWHGDMAVAHDLATHCSPETVHVLGGWIARAASGVPDLLDERDRYARLLRRVERLFDLDRGPGVDGGERATAARVERWLDRHENAGNRRG